VAAGWWVFRTLALPLHTPPGGAGWRSQCGHAHATPCDSPTLSRCCLEFAVLSETMSVMRPAMEAHRTCYRTFLTVIRPTDDNRYGRSYIINTAELYYTTQILISQSPDRRPIKSISVLGSQVWHKSWFSECAYSSSNPYRGIWEGKKWKMWHWIAFEAICFPNGEHIRNLKPIWGEPMMGLCPP